MMRPSGPSTDVEFLVAGGGPVGTALALFLRQAGKEVLLVDAGASTTKVCGEGILPVGWSVLQALGVAQRIARRAPLQDLTYQLPSPDGTTLRRLVAPLGGVSYGVQREELCRALGDATEEAGLDVWRGATLRDARFFPDHVEAEISPREKGERTTVRCRYLLGADGLHSKVRRLAGLESDKPRRWARWGARIYLRSERSRSGVVVTLGDGVESYLTPLAGDLCGLAFLWSPALLGRPLPGEGPTWQRLLRHFPPCYRETLPELEDGAFFGSDKAIGPLQQQVATPLHRNGRVALLGDAAGYLDALTGEGLCLGLAQAQLLAELLLSGQVERYPAAHRAIKRRHQLMVSGLLWLLSHPQLKERVFSAFLGAPEMFSAFIGFAVEQASWRTLAIPELPAFLAGLLQAPRRELA